MEVIHTDNAPSAIGTYSQAIRCGNVVYLSGQIPLTADGHSLCKEDIETQIKQVFENLKAVCEASKGSLANIVKLSVFLVDLAHFSLINEIMAQYFKAPYPARIALGVQSLPRDALVEMDAIMVLEGS